MLKKKEKKRRGGVCGLKDRRLKTALQGMQEGKNNEEDGGERRTGEAECEGAPRRRDPGKWENSTGLVDGQPGLRALYQGALLGRQGLES
jgi:hypothetical protein